MKLSQEQYNRLPIELQSYFTRKEDGVSRNAHPT